MNAAIALSELQHRVQAIDSLLAKAELLTAQLESARSPNIVRLLG